jgi:hypothetical protein
MSSNPYIPYYVKQVGSGISHYQGVKFQHGKGFFGNLWKSALLPFLKYAGREGARASLGVAEDALAGKNMKQSAKTRFGATGKLIGADAIKRAHNLLDQEGSGRRRKRRKQTKVSPKNLLDKVIKRKVKRRTKSVAPKPRKGKAKPKRKTSRKVGKKPTKRKSKKTELFPF